MSFDKQNFITNPNFKFCEYPAEFRECLGTTYTYDVYKDKKGRTILIAPYWNINKQCNTEGDPSQGLENYHFISLLDLGDKNKELSKLIGHKDRVVTCRFFEDPYTGKQYLISADRKYQVKIWDLTDIDHDSTKPIFDKQVQIKYDNFIYSVLMIFENGKIYAVVSTLGTGETIIYTLNSDQEPKQLKDTKDTNIYYLDYYFKKEGENGEPEHHIIQLGKNNIIVTKFNKDLTNESNYIINVKEENFANILCGMVFEKNGKNLLITSSTRGLILVIDLDSKEEQPEKRIIYRKDDFTDVFFYNFVRWNEKYILLYEALQRRILVLDTDDNYKIVSKVLCPEMYFDRFIRKVDHPIYGESILSVGIDWKIKLFINRNIVKDEEEEEEKEDKKEENKNEIKEEK